MAETTGPSLGIDTREVPTYSITEAAGYLGMSKHTLRSWALGRSYKKRGSGRVGLSLPLIATADHKNGLLSFFNLVEAHVLSSTRQLHGVQMHKIRMAIAYVQEHWPSDHPLLSSEFHTDGKNIFVKTLEETISASEKGQLSFRSIIDAYLDRIESDARGLPIRLFPFRIGTQQEQSKRVVIDPFVSSGQPVVAGTGVPVSILNARHQAGETIGELAADYGLEPIDIKEAIRFFEAA
jgi:uncharacterized protein (DUF433 family)